MKTSIPKVTLAALSFLLFALVYVYFLPGSTRDPDRYFHLRLAAIAQDQGLVVRSLPQVEDLGWGEAFTDKEWGFHVLTALAFKVGGVPLVECLPPIFAAFLFVLIQQIVGVFLPWWQAVPLTAAFCLANLNFIHRMSMLRPQLAAMFCFLLIIWGLLKEKHWLVAVSSAAYILCYHAFYVPLIVLVLRAKPKLLAYGIAGLAVGILANPYFPGSLLLGLRQVLIAWHADNVPMAYFGQELWPLPSHLWLLNYGYQAALVAVGACSWKSLACRERFLVASLAVFAGLTLIQPRSNEYSAPLAAVVFAALASLDKRVWWASFLVLALVVRAGWHLNLADVDKTVEDVGKALEKVPMGAKVYNCDWADGAFIFYMRPDIRFVDLLDPTFLMDHNRDLFRAKLNIDANEKVDVGKLIRGKFRADYALCRGWRLPAFKKLEMVAKSGGYETFSIPNP